MEYGGRPGFFYVFISDLDDETRGVHPAANSRWCLARESDWYPKWQSLNPAGLWETWKLYQQELPEIQQGEVSGSVLRVE